MQSKQDTYTSFPEVDKQYHKRDEQTTRVKEISAAVDAPWEPSLAVRLDRITDECRKRRHRLLLRVAGLIIVFLLSFNVPEPYRSVVAAITALALLISVIGIPVSKRSGSQRYRTLLHELEASEDPRLIEPQLEARGFGCKTSNLDRLLSQVRHEDGIVLDQGKTLFITMKVIDMLQATVVTEADAEWAVSVMKTLGQIAKPGRLELRHLHAISNFTPEPDGPIIIPREVPPGSALPSTMELKRGIIAAAQGSLSLLEARLKDKNSHATLLRASAGNQAPSEALLRPAGNAARAQDALLIPSSDDLPHS